MACRSSRYRVKQEWTGGRQTGNTFASYLHVHFAQRPEMLQHWLAAARRVLCTILTGIAPGAGFIIGDLNTGPIRYADSRLIDVSVQCIVRYRCPGDKALRIGGGVRGLWLSGDPGAGMGVLVLAQRTSFGWSVEVWMILPRWSDAFLAHAPRRRLNDRYGRTTLRKAE